MTQPVFRADSATVDSAAIQPLPNSRKIYVGQPPGHPRADAWRSARAATPTQFGGETNPPIYVYDTSGPYSDPQAQIDIRSGLPALRAAWIAERNDTQQLAGLTLENYGRARKADASLDALRFNLRRLPRRALPGRNVRRCTTPAPASSPRKWNACLRDWNAGGHCVEVVASHRQHYACWS